MNNTLKEQLRTLTRHRVERLLKLLDLNAPDQILANEAVLVLRGALMTWPQTGAVIGEWFTRMGRLGASVCVECGEQPSGVTSSMLMCDNCLSALTAETEEDQ